MHDFLRAIHAGDLERVRRLLAADASVARRRDPSGASAVQLAAYHGQQEILQAILATGLELDLFEAAVAGDRQRLAELLAARPAAVNEISPDGFPLLGLAAFFGHLELIELLLAAGADPDARATNAMRVAPLNSAAAHRDAGRALAMARLLLDAGADPGAAQAGGWTPLHQAAAAGNRELVELLLARGASVAAASDDGKTPQDMAAERGHPELAQLLAVGRRR